MIIRKTILASAALLTLATTAFAGNSAEFVISGSGNAIHSSQRGFHNDTQAVVSGDGNLFSNRQRGPHNSLGGGVSGNFNDIRNKQTRF